MGNQNLLTAHPDGFYIFLRFAVCVIVEVAYGPDMASDTKLDRVIELVEKITHELAAMGDTSFLDLFPFREFYHTVVPFNPSCDFLVIYFPSWIPGLKGIGVARGTSTIVLSWALIKNLTGIWDIQRELEFAPFADLRRRVVCTDSIRLREHHLRSFTGRGKCISCVTFLRP